MHAYAAGQVAKIKSGIATLNVSLIATGAKFAVEGGLRILLLFRRPLAATHHRFDTRRLNGAEVDDAGIEANCRGLVPR